MNKIIFPLISLFLLLLITSCSEYEYPVVVDPVEFEPVRYQGELDDEAVALFASDGIYRIEVDIAFDLFDDDNSDGVEYTYLAYDQASPATFTFYHDEYGEGEPLVIRGIGMRLRGGYSFDTAYKKKYKIIFPDDRKRFYGLKRINLNSNEGDNSFMREKLAYDFFNQAGIPSGRVSYARLYFYNESEPDNYEYKGLYLIVEQVKATYLKTRFGSPVGNCYKNNWSELARVSLNDWEYLSTSSNPLPALEILTNKDDYDASDIIEFAGILNDTPEELFEERIKDSLCVYEFLSALAINSLTGMIDDYWYYAHNFFLYNYYGKFMWIPWDLDSSFGVTWDKFPDLKINNIFAFQPRDTLYNRGDRPLIDRTLQVPAFVDYYRKCLKYHIEQYFNEDFLYPRIEELKALIMDAALDEDVKEGDPPFTEQIITGAIENEGISDPFALKPYIRDRKAYVLGEVEDAY